MEAVDVRAVFVQALEIDRDCSEIVGLSWSLAYGCIGEIGSSGMVRAAGAVAWDLLVFGKQIGIGCIGLSASWR